MKKFIIAISVIAFAIISCKKKKDAVPPSAPLVTTAALTNVNISAGTASGGGAIVSDGGASVTQSGLVMSKTNAIPTKADSVIAGTTATGVFTTNLTNLDFGKTYYFRAFATNSVGTGYGDVVTLTTSADSVKFTYNGQSVTYGIITSPTTGKKWLDRNLGAKRVATAYDDYQGYGDLFQWGRPADGHQLINWTASNAGTPVNGTVGGTAGTVATSDVPGHSNFIIPTYDLPLDWRSDNNRNRWATTPQGPCPAGWHVPTIAEWLAEVSTANGGTATTGGMKEKNTAYNLLKLTLCGQRIIDNPGSVIFYQTGSVGHYVSSTDHNDTSQGITDARDFEVSTSGVQQWVEYKAVAGAVRCIKDN